MRRRPRVPSSPLPQRQGIDPVHLRIPAEPQTAPGLTLRDWLLRRLPTVPPRIIDSMFAAGEFVGPDGHRHAPDRPAVPGLHLWFHRELKPEPEVPFPVTVVHRDEQILVVDKPHFLAMTPRGSHITETALARLRRDLDLPQLSPAHRLDRLTAGLALFVVDPALRGAYQNLFRDRRVRKRYEAVAPYRPDLELPCTVRSHIIKERGVIAAREVPGLPPNAESSVELLDQAGGLAHYRLTPATGRTHQLRLHLCSLGIPIRNDPVYPLLLPQAEHDDWSRPLQLLASELDFTDPVTGAERSFRTGLRLQALENGG
ncbi:pseudouridine synthase [Streptacidiphilus monticola]|uniref:RNA pseudouridylate synthase n=1 Tax=Streptacidiphilus monticola TaxID=2161674 RepID=A0ABW1G5L4_9ACTN